MMFESDIADAIARGLVLSAVGLIWIILLVRIVGLCSFSKMTNFDFVMTVAVGSLLAGASQASDWTTLIQALTAIMGLFAVQFTLSWTRQRSDTFKTVIQNNPVFLMENGKISYPALKATRVSEGDLIAKLREANALELSSIRAVVLETTGDVSVLHGPHVDEAVLGQVKRIE